MRNAGMRTMAGAGSVMVVLLLAGCTATQSAGDDNLSQGYTALSAREFDQAIAQADAHLRAEPAGEGSAEALYLKGRALEAKPAAAPQESAANLAAARKVYIQALGTDPKQPLLGYIHTSLANVCYFQEDYASAIREWTSAYDQLESPELRAWTLYRIGLCHQRLGKFDLADRTFASVQAHYPNTLPAQRAKEHQGARGFVVQIGVFSQPALADRAIAGLRQQGLLGSRTPDAQGRQVVRIGPVASYAEARSIKSRLSASHPDALILP